MHDSDSGDLSGIDIVTGDWHVPFHDKYAFKLFLRIVASLQPKRIVFNGDVGDHYILSRFDRNPERIKDSGLQIELDGIKELIAEVKSVKPADCEMHMLPGNHEDRLRRYLWGTAAGLSDLRTLQLPALLGLDELGVEFHETEYMLTPNLIAKHGRRVVEWGGGSAAAELRDERFALSTITGHTHRMGYTMVTTRHGIVGGWEGGCLCRLDPEWIKRPNWQQGIIAVRTFANSDSFSVTPIPFLGAGSSIKAVVDGRVVRL